MSSENPSLCSIGVSNFKAFGSYSELDIEPLTLLAGLNSSGKSSIYQSLLLLAQSEDYYVKSIKNNNELPMLRLNGLFIELGTTEDILHDKKNNKILFKLKWSNNSSIELEYTLTTTIKGKTKVEGSRRFVLSKYNYIGNDSSIIIKKNRLNDWSLEANNCLAFGKYNLFEILIAHVKDNMEKLGEKFPSDPDIFCHKVQIINIQSILFRQNTLYEFKSDFENILKCILPRFRKYIDISKLKSNLNKNAEDTTLLTFMVSEYSEHKKSIINTSGMEYIPPFRGYPRRVYTSDTAPGPLSGYSVLKHKVIPYRYNQTDQTTIEGKVEDALNYWVVEHFELAQRLEFRELIPGLVSEVFLVNGKTKISINNVGFGTSQIVPVIYKVLTSKMDIIIVDEPEIHLHASIQSKLATFFFEMMSLGKRLLIETHSEYLIDKIIYHNMLQPDTQKLAKLCWVVKAEEGAVVKNILHDDLGYIVNSPDGFLSEKTKLVADLNKIRMKRL